MTCMRRRPLPPSLPSAFRVAEARDAGVSSGRLRAQDLSSPFWGTRAERTLSDDERLRLLLSALPSRAFACGPTAAAVHWMPLPPLLARSAFGPLCIGVPRGDNRIRRPGVAGRSVQIDDDEVVDVRGIRVTSLVRTWVDLSATLAVPRLVAVGDALLFHRAPRLTREALVLAHARAGRAPGAAKRRLALDLMSDRSESPRESELRVILALAGLPAPEVNVDVFDGARFVARVDLLFRSARLVVEYDGDHHRDPVQWSRDQSRRAELESLGYRYTTVTARDFDDPAALVARIRRLLAR